MVAIVGQRIDHGVSCFEVVMDLFLTQSAASGCRLEYQQESSILIATA